MLILNSISVIVIIIQIREECLLYNYHDLNENIYHPT